MTLRTREPGRETIDTVRAHLSQLAGRRQFAHRELSGVDPLSVDLAAPHDVYTLGLEDIVGGAGLESAVLVGHRLLVMDGDRAVASAEVTGEDQSGFEANEGPFVEATVRAIRTIEADRELDRGDYELRMLRIPGVYLMAVWLHDERGKDDVLIPLEPAPPQLAPWRPYSAGEVLEALAVPARQVLAVDTGGEGGS